MNRVILRLCFALAALVGASGAAAATANKPELKLSTLDGKTFDLAAQSGKWVIVNFWATWCSPCIKEMPDISNLVGSRKDVTAIGLAFGDEEVADVEAFLKKHPVTYPIANVPIDAPPKDFDRPKGLPTTYLIAPDGTVAKKFTGPITMSDLEKAIAAGSKKP